ncbi:MAG: decaprenyl-phosphate phosphoribosyltransferase [Dehalococcoidia bacterium]|nr:decaprenyl-phosphate phosphoribosyltransferase [Dehalococcoidia bacterium]
MSEDERALTGPPVEPSAAVGRADALPAGRAGVGAHALPSHLRYVFRSMRPRQWTKNLIVYVALLFSISQEWEVSDASSWGPLLGWSTLAFVLFCLVSSAEYLVNDVVDRESDRQHPEKRNRPIAAGLLSVRAALTWAGALATLALAGGFALSAPLTWHVGAVLAGYIVLMLGYSFYLKHVVLMDMMAIGAGFVLRAMAGALAIDVPISPWLYVVTALGALFLVIHKRRAEITLLEEGAVNHRPILEHYSPALLDQMASLVTASTLIAYGLYTFTAENLPENNAMMLTIPFVLYGLLRYLYLVHQRNEGGSPEEILLRDWPLKIDILLWLTTAATVLVVYRD